LKAKGQAKLTLPTFSQVKLVGGRKSFRTRGSIIGSRQGIDNIGSRAQKRESMNRVIAIRTVYSYHVLEVSHL
jgi:hypothetical protein